MMTRRGWPDRIGWRQRGIATLVVAIILLVGVSMAVIFGSRVALMEQRLAANSLRSAQAASAAQAGLERALAHIRGGGVPGTCQFMGTLPESAAENASATLYWARFQNPDLGFAEPICPAVPPANIDLTDCANRTGGATRRLTIVSCGWSDDRAGLQYAVADVRAGPSLGGPGPTNPMISGTGVVFNGAARVFNLFNNLTIWSAGAFSVSGNPGNTFIRNPANPSLSQDPLVLQSSIADLPSSCGTHNTTDTYICTTDASVIGPDVIDHDYALANLSQAAFFEAFMGVPREEYKRAIASQILSGAQLNAISGPVGGQVIWVEGDLSTGKDLGSPTRPLVLIVDGNATFTGNPNFYGVLYVDGDLSVNGIPRFFGSAIIRGQGKGGGTPRFIYDPQAVRNAAQLGARAVLSGSWRDWVVTP
ncbi:hypothetical protein CKO25_12020 [Thiocapsa imhoffii]|uniref:Type 4 fimbrial biogenesis protein PilX N-terminal domain-containing protein n=1 Tax=Thiocapsa imhoffii TaxID=382777 RepID=A0A9X0WIY0_9GAMM|nr:hypothetical protein [Thiocapsa imhoffii]MBK1645355.1 hypothetical protein [Thiocapsa imhoffii]